MSVPTKKKIVFGEDGEATIESVKADGGALRLRPKNTAETFEALKVPRTPNSKLKKGVSKRERDERYRAEANGTGTGTSEQPPLPKKVKVEKDLPPGYICKACGAKDEHAIYNCPVKIPKKKMDKSKKQKEASAEQSGDGGGDGGGDGDGDGGATAAVWLEGLPFDTNVDKLREMLKEHSCDKHLKYKGITIATFSDNKNKCKGMASISYESQSAAKAAILALNGKQVGDRKLSAAYYRPKEKSDPSSSSSSSSSFKRKNAVAIKGEKVKHCYRCGGAHDHSTCTEARVCYRCLSTEHLSSECPKKKNPKQPRPPTATSTTTSKTTETEKFSRKRKSNNAEKKWVREEY
jgi:hypothetical protein